MSLRVWLPLNGNLENKGLSNISFSATTATWNASGKIGQALSTLNSNVIGNCSALNGISTFSLAFWCFPKTNSSISTNWCNIIALGSKSADNSTSAEFRFESSYVNNYILSHHNNIGEPIGGGTGTLVSDRDKWYHVVVVANNEAHTIRYYVNGIQLTASSFLKTHNGGHLDGTIKLANENVDPDCLINDVRIYDHALSAKEVEEIAKGLVLHYKLDELNSNLFYTSPKSYVASAYNAYQFNMTENLVAGETYTIQLWDVDVYHSAKTAAQTGVWVYWGGGSVNLFNWAGSTYFTQQGTTNYHADYLVKTFTPTSSQASGIGATNLWLNIYNSMPSADGTRNMHIGAWKLEKGSIATPWKDCADNNIIYDSSGYENNGTLTISSSSIIPDSPRYGSSLCLSKKKISTNTGFPTGANPDFTVVFWTRLYSDITYVSYGDLVGMNDIAEGANSPFRLELCGTPPSNNLMWFRGPSGQAAGGFNMNTSSFSGWFSKEVWHQIALTGNGATKQYLCYLDGTQCGYYNGSSNTWTPDGKIYFGDTVEATADFSDCRVYATVLTAAQIKELYETSMSIDNKGNIHTRELVEV